MYEILYCLLRRNIFVVVEWKAAPDASENKSTVSIDNECKKYESFERVILECVTFIL